jgi:hypothetical protein
MGGLRQLKASQVWLTILVTMAVMSCVGRGTRKEEAETHYLLVLCYHRRLSGESDMQQTPF